jgi:hypothetical protein
MPQNPLDDAAVFDEGDDFHLGPASGAGQGVGFPYLRNEPAPLGGGGRTVRFGRCRAVPDLCRLPFCPDSGFQWSCRTEAARSALASPPV